MGYFEDTETFLDDAINRRVKALSPLDAESYFETRNTRLSDPKAAFIAKNMHRIYGNISAMLTHVSAMIASLGIILIVFDDTKITQIFIFLEMVAYTFIAVLCVFCLRNRGLTPEEEDIAGEQYIDEYYKNYLNRRYIFTLCFKGVMLITILFMFTIISHVFALALA